jgi:uncharacterized protein (TIGR02444 family)
MSEPADKPSSESEFWRFSLSLYALPHVAAACLVLQDEAGVDVNLLLYLLFLAKGGRQAAPANVAHLDAAVRDWRDETVKPLRALRRGLKAGIGEIPPAMSEGFRNMIKRVELEAERIEQLRLETLGAAMRFASEPSPSAAARANLASYARMLGSFPETPLAAVLSGFEQVLR